MALEFGVFISGSDIMGRMALKPLCSYWFSNIIKNEIY